MTNGELVPLPDRDGLDNATPPPLKTRTELLKEGVLALPKLAVLLYSLLRDPRVPRRPKAIAGLIAGYVVSPIDLLPDAIPFVGRLDDVVLMAAAINVLLESAPEEVVVEMWQGEPDTLEIIDGLTAWMSGMLPKALRRFLRGA